MRAPECSGPLLLRAGLVPPSVMAMVRSKFHEPDARWQVLRGYSE